MMSLIDWQRSHLQMLRGCTMAPSPLVGVTVLAYFFGSEEYAAKMFWRTEFAFLKTFETNGLMSAVLVCNNATEEMKSFSAKYNIDIQIESTLIPGDINSMSRDCLLRLHRRFDTEYVLIVQNDGFPMRKGLSEFVGLYDYVGAPFVRFISLNDFYPYKYCVGNGGFSLRSKRLCREVSRIYGTFFSRLPFIPLFFCDDNFYCRFLRVFWPRFNRHFKFPSSEVAGLFSIEHNEDFMPKEGIPLGFHAEAGFLRLIGKMPELISGSRPLNEFQGVGR